MPNSYHNCSTGEEGVSAFLLIPFPETILNGRGHYLACWGNLQDHFPVGFPSGSDNASPGSLQMKQTPSTVVI